MDPFHVRHDLLIECLVMLFQFVGLAGLGLAWLAPTRRWRGRGQTLVLVAMVGLGLSGAACGRQDSAFGLFAGGTLTFLFIGMIAGGASPESTVPTGLPDVAEPSLLA
jgi:hypothetical protein